MIVGSYTHLCYLQIFKNKDAEKLAKNKYLKNYYV
jgi:hypothetical protein